MGGRSRIETQLGRIGEELGRNHNTKKIRESHKFFLGKGNTGGNTENLTVEEGGLRKDEGYWVLTIIFAKVEGIGRDIWFFFNKLGFNYYLCEVCAHREWE